MAFESINPYNGRRLHRFVSFAWPKAERLLGQARRAAPGWAATPLPDRAAVLCCAAPPPCCASARMSWPA